MYQPTYKITLWTPTSPSLKVPRTRQCNLLVVYRTIFRVTVKRHLGVKTTFLSRSSTRQFSESCNYLSTSRRGSKVRQRTERQLSYNLFITLLEINWRRTNGQDIAGVHRVRVVIGPTLHLGRDTRSRHGTKVYVAALVRVIQQGYLPPVSPFSSSQSY